MADFVQRNRTLAGTRDRVAAEKTKTEALSAHVCAGESLPGLEKAVAALNTEVTRAQRSVDDLQRKSSTHADKMAGTAGDQRRKDTARVRDLEETNRLMKAELNRLQHEMVSLDRKKAVLEKDIGM